MKGARVPRLPDTRGHFGVYGGRYVSETLMPALLELEREYQRARRSPRFGAALRRALCEYAGRPTPLSLAGNLTRHCGGASLFLKREDLCHTGAHKINNTLGQGLLARHMQKPRVIAETGAGQHGVATATVAALLGRECEIFMGREDVHRQSLNVFRMKLLGASVRVVETGTGTLKDAMNEALRDWIGRVRDTYYLVGSTAGPHPYPMMVRDFQSVIGRETKRQLARMTGRGPDVLVACVGGGSNAMGLFYPFLGERRVRMVGVEAGGEGLRSGRHAASIAAGTVGVLHGAKTYLLQDEMGQVRNAHSISAGLDYPGVGPELSFLRDSGRVEYVTVTDDEAVEAVERLAGTEGIISALESAHAVAYAMRLARRLPRRATVVINLSGRGDKDVETIARYRGVTLE